MAAKKRPRYMIYANDTAQEWADTRKEALRLMRDYNRATVLKVIRKWTKDGMNKEDE